MTMMHLYSLINAWFWSIVSPKCLHFGRCASLYYRFWNKVHLKPTKPFCVNRVGLGPNGPFDCPSLCLIVNFMMLHEALRSNLYRIVFIWAKFRCWLQKPQAAIWKPTFACSHLVYLWHWIEGLCALAFLCSSRFFFFWN